ncbi:MAG: IS30 family transposase [Candidatus Paceibacterota bacterium]
MRIYMHLCFGDRKKIERFLRQRKSLREIARVLKRSVSNISNEVKNNSVSGIYNAKKAQHKADVKREKSKRDCLKVAMNKELQKFVVDNIKDHQSPEGISGRLKYVEKGIEYASSKAIYKFVESPHGRQIEKCLYSNAVKKKTGKKRGTSVGIDGRVFIDKRPKHIEKRIEFGHFEGDFIESGKDGKGSLLVLVERKTRYPFLVYLEDRSNRNVNRLIEELLFDIPVKSLTLDNDISFQKHQELSELLDATVYFCHPQSPNEKGTVENRNKAIRRYVKKKSDLSSFPLSHFKMVEEKLRNKYMTCLNFKTPQEEFDRELQKQKRPQSVVLLRESLLTS